LSEQRLKIAVFIDFDNIAIGVKQSLSRNFEIGTVLEAIKEKGEVVTKIAYGDWKRAEDYSRAMTQHAVQMVQRNLTPGGDKNGADIALALDALEMAFTRNHINTFVIVGGDSDFIALVEKLKQYDKTVFVVGGRAFTSVILQKNCHEFISYENLIGTHSAARRSAGKAQVSSQSRLENALPLIYRAVKVLSDREVSPQLGLLKSTLLQLDSTFSERDYGVSSFRDFIQKLADAGYLTLKQVDRSLLVELREASSEAEAEEISDHQPSSTGTALPESPGSETADSSLSPQEHPAAPDKTSEAVNALEEIFRDSNLKPHWPMYLRGFKQFLRSLQPPFDERQYGLSSAYDLVRQAQKEGLLRVERNRQGILRIFPSERPQQGLVEKPVEEPIPLELPLPTAVPEVQAENPPETPQTDSKPEGYPDSTVLVKPAVPEAVPTHHEEKPSRRRRRAIPAAPRPQTGSHKKVTRKTKAAKEKRKDKDEEASEQGPG